MARTGNAFRAHGRVGRGRERIEIAKTFREILIECDVLHIGLADEMPFERRQKRVCGD
jgi:hypothetical protein